MAIENYTRPLRWGLLFRAEFVGAALVAARKPIQNNRVNFYLYVVPLWVNRAKGKVLGRLKRRPYGFCFYAVLLWANSANGFCFVCGSIISKI